MTKQIDSILKRSLPELKKTMDDKINFVDIDYEVVNPKKSLANGTEPWTTKTRKTVMRDAEAIANAYRLWLQSGKYDYVRKPNLGGFFDSQLNDRFPFSPESEEDVKTALINETKEKWPDLTLVDVEVKCKESTRSWWIRVGAMIENNSNLPIIENLEVENPV